MRFSALVAVAFASSLVSCGGDPGTVAVPSAPSASGSPKPAENKPAIISIVGTSDLHGHIETTAILGGYLKNLRKAREADGAVLLVDGGDMFQGTLESNLSEGMAVLHAYKALGYAAAAVGNHEFDYGPVGPHSTPQAPGEDPRGALFALANAASFPMLASNVMLKATHERLPLGKPSVVVAVAGFRVGIIGITSADTLRTTAFPNVSDLEIAPLAPTVAAESKRLRGEEHADVVLVLAHAGGKCKRTVGDFSEDGCEPDGEIFRVAEELPAGTIDAIVAGHTHQVVSETVHGIPIIQSYSYGKAFGRIDLTLTRDSTGASQVVSMKRFAPRDLCSSGDSIEACSPGEYEGAPVLSDPAVEAAIVEDFAKAKGKRSESLGVVFAGIVHRSHEFESEEGNLFADLLRKGHPDVTIAMMNGGGLRADMPAGELLYGSLYEAFPFDNRVARTTLTGADLQTLLEAHLRHKTGGLLSISGATVAAACDHGKLRVEIKDSSGRPIRPTDKVRLLASDFMMTGGDEFWGGITPPKVEFSEENMRDGIEAELRKLKQLEPNTLVSKDKPRIKFAGERPVKCAK